MTYEIDNAGRLVYLAEACFYSHPLFWRIIVGYGSQMSVELRIAADEYWLRLIGEAQNGHP